MEIQTEAKSFLYYKQRDGTFVQNVKGLLFKAERVNKVRGCFAKDYRFSEENRAGIPWDKYNATGLMSVDMFVAVQSDLHLFNVLSLIFTVLTNDGSSEFHCLCLCFRTADAANACVETIKSWLITGALQYNSAHISQSELMLFYNDDEGTAKEHTLVFPADITLYANAEPPTFLF